MEIELKIEDNLQIMFLLPNWTRVSLPLSEEGERSLSAEAIFEARHARPRRSSVLHNRRSSHPPKLLCSRGRINASTDLLLKHTRNKLYKELVLKHLVLQLFDESRKCSTRFVSTGI